MDDLASNQTAITQATIQAVTVVLMALQETDTRPATMSIFLMQERYSGLGTAEQLLGNQPSIAKP